MVKLDKYDNTKTTDPPFSSTEKGEVEHCALTKYCDERVLDSSFTIKSERERLLKSQPFKPLRYEDEINNKWILLTVVLIILFSILFACLLYF